MIISNYQITAPTTFGNNKLKPMLSVVDTVTKDSGRTMDYLQSLSNINSSVVARVKPYDIPIKNEEEFNQVMERVFDAKTQNGNILWLDRKNYKKNYPKVSNVEKGLLPYCGDNDSSEFINMYLSGRINNPDIQERWKGILPMHNDSCVDVIRALEYSLKNLDNEFGKYKGIVYRQGFMNENGGQYFSTSKRPAIAGQFRFNWYHFDKDAGYSVIRTKNGHKICDFQKKMGSDYGWGEEEILLPYQSKYKQVKPEEMDNELKCAREQMAGMLFGGAEFVVSGSIPEHNGYNRKQLLDLVKVFDEV